MMCMWITSKLGDIHQSLSLPAEQGKIKGFLTNPENVQRVNTLVEDIREALMEYQVCILGYSFPTTSNVCTRLHCNRTFMMRAADSW